MPTRDRDVDDPQEPFTIVVLGDFTGRANRGGSEPLHTRKLQHIDVDNCARVFAQLGARLQLTGPGVPGNAVDLTFTSLDDFHPDKLLARVPSLAKLTDARRLALNPATVEEGKAALQAYLGAALAAPARLPADSTSTTRESDDDTMSRLIGGAPQSGPRSTTPVSQVDQFIRQVVAQHVPSAPGPWRSGTIAAEMELTGRLRAMLHHPDLQALEAAWRGIDMLVRRIESSEEIGLFLLDVSHAELQADLLMHEEDGASALARLLRDRAPNLIVGNYTFGRTADDLRALGALADLASALSVPFIATAAPALVGADCFGKHADPDDWTETLPADAATAWAALRQSATAGHAGLTAPRFMMRQPYGKDGEVIETFPFEELPGEPAHESFLWGHSGILCACVVIDALQAGDMELTDFAGGEVGDLPVHTSSDEGEVVATSYAEAWLTERAANRLITCGVIPVMPVKHHNAIRLFSFPSISRTPAALTFTAG